MNVLVGSAWVYANGPLHIGHIAGLLPADVIARYYRLKGDKVSFVSGSDSHGTPITIRAKKEGKDPKEISDYYHRDFVKGFDYLGFSYDYFGKTASQDHIDFVTDFHKKLYESDYIYEKEEAQAYCESCEKFLPGRLVIGVCPHCGGTTKGDQCDHCDSELLGTDILEAKCHDCGNKPIFKSEKHIYLGVSRLEKELKDLVDKSPSWRKNAIDFTNRYITEGLRDRTITRNIDWGIRIPKEDYENKRIYIWAENVLGYISSCKVHGQNEGFDYEDFWADDARQYYVHGKDNIPFHTIILPSLQLLHGQLKKLPDYIISSEYLTLEGSKISTSNEWAIWINDLIGKYNPDAVRYYLLANNPEKRDGDFTFRSFKYANNSELLGGYGNFINRTLTFIKKSFNNQIPSGVCDFELEVKIVKTYEDVGKLIENGNIKDGIRSAFELVRFANKYFDEKKPWISLKENPEEANHTLYNCIYLIINLARILEPFLPFSSATVLNWFNIDKKWEAIKPELAYELPQVHLLFERLDQDVI